MEASPRAAVAVAAQDCRGEAGVREAALSEQMQQLEQANMLTNHLLQHRHAVKFESATRALAKHMSEY